MNTIQNKEKSKSTDSTISETKNNNNDNSNNNNNNKKENLEKREISMGNSIPNDEFQSQQQIQQQQPCMQGIQQQQPRIEKSCDKSQTLTQSNIIGQYFTTTFTPGRFEG